MHLRDENNIKKSTHNNFVIISNHFMACIYMDINHHHIFPLSRYLCIGSESSGSWKMHYGIRCHIVVVAMEGLGFPFSSFFRETHKPLLIRIYWLFAYIKSRSRFLFNNPMQGFFFPFVSSPIKQLNKYESSEIIYST